MGDSDKSDKERRKQAAEQLAASVDTDRYRVDPGTTVELTSWPTDGAVGADPEVVEKAYEELNEEIEELQELLYADNRQKVLVVLQATDTGGKDGTIRHVFEHVNPQGVKVASFKKPSELERSHDYLWRVHRHTPADGQIVVFNRSHYEDVLVVRVHGLVPEERWRRRYAHIRNFEQMLADEGTTIVKFFLHISRAEQKRRLQSRLDRPHKRWKFSTGDLAERERWDDYQAAFAEMLGATSTPDAPWYVIPADDKDVRNLLISKILVDTLTALPLEWPQPEEGLDEIVID